MHEQRTDYKYLLRIMVHHWRALRSECALIESTSTLHWLSLSVLNRIDHARGKLDLVANLLGCRPSKMHQRWCHIDFVASTLLRACTLSNMHPMTLNCCVCALALCMFVFCIRGVCRCGRYLTTLVCFILCFGTWFDIVCGLVASLLTCVEHYYIRIVDDYCDMHMYALSLELSCICHEHIIFWCLMILSW